MAFTLRSVIVPMESESNWIGAALVGPLAVETRALNSSGRGLKPRAVAFSAVRTTLLAPVSNRKSCLTPPTWPLTRNVPSERRVIVTVPPGPFTAAPGRRSPITREETAFSRSR